MSFSLSKVQWDSCGCGISAQEEYYFLVALYHVPDHGVQANSTGVTLPTPSPPFCKPHLGFSNIVWISAHGMEGSDSFSSWECFSLGALSSIWGRRTFLWVLFIVTAGSGFFLECSQLQGGEGISLDVFPQSEVGGSSL